MKKTRKWAFVKQEAVRLAGLKLSPKEIAERLELSKSTVTRWIAAGKLPKADPPRDVPAPTANQTPDEWAEAMRQAWALDATDEQLVQLAKAALAMSRDDKMKPHIQLQAAGRFQALVRQLAIGKAPRAADSAPAEPAKPEPKARLRVVLRRVSGDPRQVLES